MNLPVIPGGIAARYADDSHGACDTPAPLARRQSALSWRLGVSHHFPTLTGYLVLSLFTDLSRCVVIGRSGFASEQDTYLYYYSDLLLAVALYLVVVELYRRTLPAQNWELLRQCSLAIFGLLALVSFAEIWQSDWQRMLGFAYQLADKLHFLSLGLILFLWAFIHLRNLPRGIAAHMVQVWGIYFLLSSTAYVTFYFFYPFSPSAPRLHNELPLMAQVWLPLGLGFAIVQSSQQHLSLKS